MVLHTVCCLSESSLSYSICIAFFVCVYLHSDVTSLVYPYLPRVYVVHLSLTGYVIKHTVWHSTAETPT